MADYLPWACLVAPGVVLNKDGSFQRTARYRGPDLESATEAELVATMARINNVLKRFGSGWALFIEADRRPARDYPVSEFPDAASALVDAERRAALEEAGAHFETRYWLTFTYLPPPDGIGRAEQMFLDRGETKGATDYARAHQGFIDHTDRALDLLSAVLPEIAPLNDEETLTYLHACISDKPHRVAVPDTPAYLDAILTDAPLLGGLEPKLGEAHLRTLSIQGFPDATTPGLLGTLDELGFAYRWVTRFIALDKREAERLLKRTRRQWFAKRKGVTAILKEVMTNEASALVDSDADHKAADADAALAELGQDLVSFGYLTTTVTVSDPDRERAEDKRRAMERVINGRGFTTISESVNAVEAWLSSLPGHVYANIRQPVVHTLNLAHLAPFSAVWAGPERNAHLNAPALITARTAGSTPFRLDLHQGDVGHTLIVGPTGAGKSVLLALIAMQFRRYAGSRLFVFDKGRSSRAAILAMGGRFVELSLAGEIAFQPLARIDKAAERSAALDWAVSLLAHEGVTLDPQVKETLWSALTSLAGAPVQERTLTGLSLLLQSRPLAQALQPYTLEGPYGALLDADEDRLSLADITAFEMEELMQSPAVAAPVLQHLFHRQEARFDGAPTLIILDEAWLFLDRADFAGRIRDWLKTLRKKNVAVIFATQSLADIADSAIAPALIESCPSRIFLPNDRAIEPQSREAYQRFGLNDRQIAILSQAVPKREYYFQSRAGNRLFELGLGEVALAFCAASSPADQRLIDEGLAAHGEADFATAWLRAKGLDWAAELISEGAPAIHSPSEEGADHA